MSSVVNQESELCDRLKELRHDIGVSQAEMARRVGKSQQTWGAYEAGTSTPPVDVIQKILVDQEVSANWLLKGGGNRKKKVQGAREPRSPFTYTGPREKAITIPLLRSYLGAGAGGWAEDEDEALILAGDHLRSWMRQEAGVDPERAFLAEIRGRSMETWAHDGDLVIGERCDSIEHDDIYAVAYKEELLVKHCLRRGDTLTLRSQNSMYDDIVVGLEGDLRVIGRVVRRIVA